MTLETETAVHIPSGAGILSDYGVEKRPMRNGASGKVAMVSRRPHQVYDDEVFEEVRYLRRPTGRGTVTEAAFASSHWEPETEAAFVAAWDAEADELPRVHVETIVLLTGLLLPIWKTIPSDNERIWRVTPEDGQSRIGRAISPDQALVLKGRFRTGGEAAPDELVASVMATDATVDLGRGLTMRARRVAGAKRLELAGWSPSQVPTLKAAGCFTEIIAHQLRVFVPVGDGAAGTIEAIRAGRGVTAA